jgi:hypothetical protein
MKKLLLLLFSLLLSFNSYGEWTKLFTDDDGMTWHINLEKIQERDGLVYMWQMSSDKEDSEVVLSENDCKLSRTKYVQYLQYEKPLMKGDSAHLPVMEEWTYLPPDTVGEVILEFGCELVPLSLEERKEWINPILLEFNDLMELRDTVNWANSVYEDQLDILESAWIGNIAAEVKSVWNFSGAEDGWFVEVLVTQNKEGKVLNVKFGENNVGNSSQAKAFLNSVERAIYKSSPLPIAPDASVWDKNIMFTFTP